MTEFDFLASLPAIMPEIGLTLLAIIVLGLDLYLPESKRTYVAYTTAAGLALLAITPLISNPDSGRLLGWDGSP